MHWNDHKSAEGNPMKPKSFSKMRALAIGAAVAVLCSACSSEAPSRPERISALALKASPAAYALFQKDLDEVKADNDFTMHLKNPANYDVYVSETSDDFLFSFSVRPMKGERLLDGRSVYAVSKRDGAATIRSML
jgi:hypothetical protein